jgi:adenylate cyclase
MIAEIELQHEDEVFAKPEWIAEEVSNDPRYRNSYLVEHPFVGWN